MPLPTRRVVHQSFEPGHGRRGRPRSDLGRGEILAVPQNSSSSRTPAAAPNCGLAGTRDTPARATAPTPPRTGQRLCAVIPDPLAGAASPTSSSNCRRRPRAVDRQSIATRRRHHQLGVVVTQRSSQTEHMGLNRLDRVGGGSSPHKVSMIASTDTTRPGAARQQRQQPAAMSAGDMDRTRLALDRERAQHTNSDRTSSDHTRTADDHISHSSHQSPITTAAGCTPVARARLPSVEQNATLAVSIAHPCHARHVLLAGTRNGIRFQAAPTLDWRQTRPKSQSPAGAEWNGQLTPTSDPKRRERSR